MSDIIEERLQGIYKNKNVSISVTKYSFRSYEVFIQLDYKQGFTFIFTWFENLTIDSNIEQLVKIIDNLIISFYKDELRK